MVDGHRIDTLHSRGHTFLPFPRGSGTQGADVAMTGSLVQSKSEFIGIRVTKLVGDWIIDDYCVCWIGVCGLGNRI